MTDTLSRRAVLAGACGTCAAAVAGCAAYDSSTSSNPVPVTAGADTGGARATTDAADAGPGAGAGAASGLVATADVPVGGGKIFGDEGVVITQPTAGEFKAFSTVCTHAGCAVNEVRGGEISCPCHASTFAIADGAPTGGPADKPLEERDITVEGTSISLA